MAKKKIGDVVDSLKESHRQIKRQCEEHLSSINENTTEIQSLFDYLNELDLKIEKLSQRLDSVQLDNKDDCKQSIYSLNHIEKKIFLTLYTEEMPLTLREIAERANISVAVINEHITSLAQLGIPLTRTVANNQIFVKLHDNFKELQAKENVVNLSLTSFM